MVEPSKRIIARYRQNWQDGVQLRVLQRMALHIKDGDMAVPRLGWDWIKKQWDEWRRK